MNFKYKKFALGGKQKIPYNGVYVKPFTWKGNTYNQVWNSTPSKADKGLDIYITYVPGNVNTWPTWVDSRLLPPLIFIKD